MAPQPPQTLSVKRKRNDPPVQQLVVDAEHTVKRQKSELFEPQFTWRLIQKAGEQVPLSLPSPTQQNRRFHVSLSAAGQRVLIEATGAVNGAVNGAQTATSETENASDSTPFQKPAIITRDAPATPRPRKRPGAGAAPRINPAYTTQTQADSNPSDEQVKHFEDFSAELEQEEIAKSKPQPSPIKYLPTGPARRPKDRKPALAVRDPDAMDLDDYVFDTYIREEVLPDVDGKLPESVGTIGYIVLRDEDEEWWNGEEESDREFDTDEDDENAEDYYANDYPEDELSDDDEFDRDPYQRRYRRGSDDEEYDLERNEGAYSGDEDDEHFRRMTAASGNSAFMARLGR